jgi:deoxyribose-phosphate aldolase
VEVVMESVIDARLARRAIALVDLTDLSDGCTSAAIDSLCERAARHGTAAVCVWPDFVAQAAALLGGSRVEVATVVDFPSGDERPFAVGVVTQRVLDDGATEVDVVLPYRAFAAGDLTRSSAMLTGVRRLTDGTALMKVILETGELPDLATVERAARFAIEHGADFIKTSTGKSPISATLPAAETMLGVIASSNRTVGIKPSGGISTAADAGRYIAAAEHVMGAGWVSPSTFRFGASGLLDALLLTSGDAASTVGATAGQPSY